MSHQETITELVSGYEAYSEVEELNISAASDAPASGPYCVTLEPPIVVTIPLPLDR